MSISLTKNFPAVLLAHKPTPLERLNNLSQQYGVAIWVKRDDCTGLAFGGNKARQLEYYIGHALQQNADILLTTGAVQSNHVRQTVAAARKLGIDVEVQLEHRVDSHAPEYQRSGNPFLVQLMGAKIHHYPVGEDEDGADKALYQRAEQLRAGGKNPYVIPLSNAHTPWGALGYVEAAEELLQQLQALELTVDAFVLASGSASTHAGFLTGLRALDDQTPVYGFCVRREADLQTQRVWTKTMAVAQLLGCEDKLSIEQVICDDSAFAPGYGLMSDKVQKTLKEVAQNEGLLLDPTYTAKSFTGLLELIERAVIQPGGSVVYLHTGGTPSLFGYPELII